MRPEPAVLPQVVWGRSSEVLAKHPEAESLLTPVWRERWGRFRREQDAEDFLAARVLAFDLVRELVGADVRIEQHCDGCGRAGHGRPIVFAARGGPLEVAVSWAHSRGLVVAASAQWVSRLGVDLEIADPDAPVAPEVLVPGRHFVRAEALVKASVMDLDAALSADLAWSWGREHTLAETRVRDLNFAEGAIGALAWR